MMICIVADLSFSIFDFKSLTVVFLLDISKQQLLRLILLYTYASSIEWILEYIVFSVWNRSASWSKKSAISGIILCDCWRCKYDGQNLIIWKFLGNKMQLNPTNS